MESPKPRCLFPEILRGTSRRTLGGREESTVTTMGVSRLSGFPLAQLPRATSMRAPVPCSFPPRIQPRGAGLESAFQDVSATTHSAACEGDGVGRWKPHPRRNQEQERWALTPALGNFAASSWVKWSKARSYPPHRIPHSSSRAWLTEKIIQKTLRLCPRCYNSRGTQVPMV